MSARPSVTQTPAPGVVIERLALPDPQRELGAVRAGLLASPRQTDPKYFYDDTGSALFDRICTLPEYYPTRTERRLLSQLAGPIAHTTGAMEVVELGSGSAQKTRLLLDAVAQAAGLRHFVPFDWSAGTVSRVANELRAEYPRLQVHGIVGDFTTQLESLPRAVFPRLVVFLGGTIGNFRPADARHWLERLAGRMHPGEHLLLGTDLVKSPARLEAAYDDAAGVTACFNRNALVVLNRIVGADFEPRRFKHRARYDAQARWIEMHLVATTPHRVRLPALDLELDLEAGEAIRTEISAKYDQRSVDELLDAAGFDRLEWHTDREGLFALSLSRRR